MMTTKGNDKMTFTDAEKTDWFIAEATKHGINVRKKTEAPNGGEVIFFDMPHDIQSGKKRPYFMIWTGNGDDYKWHPEFGHWYFPKNDKERRACPTTEYYKEEQLAEAIAKYAKEIKEEAAE
jgi:hypothetical protein